MSAASTQPFIELRDVYKSFGDNHVLKGLDVSVAEGETLVILGASGTGKSVLLKTIIGLLKPDRGSVRVGDVDVAAAEGDRLREVRRQVAYLFQTGALVNWMTVRDNVALPLVETRRMQAAEIRRRTDDVLRSLDMLEAAEHLPGEISGGMRKRAALCRVLVQEPRAILYDEPTAGLDPILSRTVGELIQDVQHNEGRSAVVVTHDLALAFTIADRIGLHHEGKLVEVAPPDAFRTSQHPVIRSFLAGTNAPRAPLGPPRAHR